MRVREEEEEGIIEEGTEGVREEGMPGEGTRVITVQR